MNFPALRYNRPATLIGGGDLEPEMIRSAMAFGPHLIAADGAADRLADLGFTPDVIIGDLDSLAQPDRWRSAGTQVIELPEQDTTDFEKCLYSIEAPYFVGAGFTGGRVDHTLAVFHAMLAQAGKTVFLVGRNEVLTLVPPDADLRLDLAVGAVVSLFPLAETRGVSSQGLEWPIEGLSFAAGRRVGTSNRAVSAQIALRVQGRGLLIMVPRPFLSSLIEGVMASVDQAG